MKEQGDPDSVEMISGALNVCAMTVIGRHARLDVRAAAWPPLVRAAARKSVLIHQPLPVV